MTDFETPEQFLNYLRDEEGLEAYFEPTATCCASIVAYEHGLPHWWHEPNCTLMAAVTAQIDEESA